MAVRCGSEGKTLVSSSERADKDDRKQVLTHFAGSHNFRPALTLLVPLPLLSISIPTHRHPRLLNWFHHFQPLLLPLPLSVRASFRQLFGGAQNESLVYVFRQPAADVLAVRLLPASWLRIRCWLPRLRWCLWIMWWWLWRGSRWLPNRCTARWSSSDRFCPRLSDNCLRTHSDNSDLLMPVCPGTMRRVVTNLASSQTRGRKNGAGDEHSCTDPSVDRMTWAGWTGSVEPEIS